MHKRYATCFQVTSFVECKTRLPFKKSRWALTLMIDVQHNGVSNVTFYERRSYILAQTFNKTTAFFFHASTAPSGSGPPHYRGLTITLRHTKLCRTPVDEGSTSRRDLYLTTHNTHTRQTSMPPAWFETAISASEKPQAHAGSVKPL